MAHTDKPIAHSTRSRNLEALMQAPRDKLKSLMQSISDGWKIQAVALPQAGLGLLKMQDGAFHEAFYMGEFPLVTAHLSITLPDGEVIEGAAAMMSDDQAHVEALAICDAILTHQPNTCQANSYQAITSLLAEGQNHIAQEARKRRAMLAKTRVDFSLLADTGQHT